ncbi:MAG: sigma-70 family RNA polymerase sigma factor [Polyangiaceae bacterium]|nr:sigma-70 family RNA polymerase sigma factor [Polyangiaceae bacterium]
MDPLEDDPRFIERLRRRDEHAFNELVRMFETRVYRLVFRMLGREAEAEDVAQEVFVQVFRAVEQFRSDSKLSTWIYRIASNLSKNRLKYLARRASKSQVELTYEGEQQEHSHAQGLTLGETARPDQLVEGFQVQEILRRAIFELEPDFREAIVLRDLECLSYEEIGVITGLTEGTVKSRIFRARALLKERVELALGDKIR